MDGVWRVMDANTLDATTSSTTAGGKVVSKSEALKYAMVIGFGVAAGIHLYVAWASLLGIVWSAIKGVFIHG